MDVTSAGGLYLSVSLPNLIVGTVGGGTGLPTARECLQMMDCFGEGRARKFAEICAATVLVGELSLIGAITAGEYGQAHALYGRKPRGPDRNRHE
jgi:hydroxymethylglutaryl-CoA reductase (NADPH)